MTRIEMLTDLHPRSDRALDRAALVADACAAELTITHAFDPLSLDDRAHTEEEGVLFLDPDGHFRSALALSRPLPAHWLAVEGEARKFLPGHVDRSSPDLVVMGMDRDYTLSKIVLGGLADRIAAATRPPLLVVKRRPVGCYRRVLAAFDGSDRSAASLACALRLAPGAGLLCLHAPADAPAADSASERTDPQRALDRVFAEHREHDGAPPARVELRRVEGDILSAMLEAERSWKPDLTVFGRSARTGLLALVQGSHVHLLLSHLQSDSLLGPR